jgi:hypothetical protein
MAPQAARIDTTHSLHLPEPGLPQPENSSFKRSVCGDQLTVIKVAAGFHLLIGC